MGSAKWTVGIEVGGGIKRGGAIKHGVVMRLGGGIENMEMMHLCYWKETRAVGGRPANPANPSGEVGSLETE
jgi:hypothetical protein